MADETLDFSKEKIRGEFYRKNRLFRIIGSGNLGFNLGPNLGLNLGPDLGCNLDLARGQIGVETAWNRRKNTGQLAIIKTIISAIENIFLLHKADWFSLRSQSAFLL